ncbi:undecaprenyldiphospho-muramoylpentapeptide beta-N-acetylglucosaminyltransferase [Xanthobacter agilis]|uniref:UDP-N-acetylglucosamine--N-acetylmuramyl-(pentapeptide) pyrophosphoryl-undecaprenol N-acetylglucosamine transferase n=1 Tax=Xanthobacter agilis TaxID=47492 RepID=A0ABU0L9U9_XANAG|nr:undecaprenyldiphospho-muramoylpentapeptide beta-N-acetylglucosaminyltransferase [Xanthobacter agilis]MDQ0503905.1 UDP-N-acetylglucosamine--N-acetylmuramyl-(pentapeptide) pyrophosphoryl-undecaprenol N-acetylglucosamine transferase [Xanthobacter agilis]
MTPLVLLAAGGTGGHLFPAEALAAVLDARGLMVDLATDERAAHFAGAFPAREVHVLPADTVRGRSPVALARTGLALASGLVRGLALMRELKPAAVVGFGGYPTLPPLLAASLMGVPTVIHESNGVMGRANRLLAGRVSAIATGFPDLLKANPALAAKAVCTGNPLRPAALAAARVPYDAPVAGGPLRLLVFGGSQGARVMSDVVPEAIAQLPPEIRARLTVTQQAREEDLPRVRTTYDVLGLKSELAPFFEDLPARMARAHLVISRSGAGTVAELAAIGRPSILVPLPHALDQDQAANARALADIGGALALRQVEFDAGRLAGELMRFADAPDTLTQMAERARSAGVLDAAERLADLVQHLAGGGTAATFQGPRS